jgi:uncharacterized protein (DUF2147 family)
VTADVCRSRLLAACRALAQVLVAWAVVFALAASAAVPAPTGTEDIHGLWVDHRDGDKRKVAVWIEDCDGLLCGRIYWLKKPLSGGGVSKRDTHNPDAALQARPLCGLRILSGFQRARERHWTAGQIYNPSDGRTFKSTIELEQDGSLRIRGFVGIALFGKTVEWVRPQEPLERCSSPPV